MKKELYYFTGTGNTLHIAKEIAKNMDGADLISISKLKNTQVVESSADITGIIFPVYFMNPPDILEEFFEKLKIKEGSYLFLVCNCGANFGGTLKVAEKTLNKGGNKLSAAYNIYMPDNSIAFPTPLDEHDGMIEKMIEETKQIALNAINGVQNVPIGNMSASFFGNVLMKNACKGILGFDKMKLDAQKCTNCGICQKVCPVNNIESGEQKPEWGNECQMCFACIHYCPQKAVTYKRQKPEKDYQYRNKYININEIMDR
ncbi:MAG: EFR1 family ferrodoxin [Eubacteriales bacterium]